jgi:hypothetical protein
MPSTARTNSGGFRLIAEHQHETSCSIEGIALTLQPDSATFMRFEPNCRLCQSRSSAGRVLRPPVGSSADIVILRSPANSRWPCHGRGTRFLRSSATTSSQLKSRCISGRPLFQTYRRNVEVERELRTYEMEYNSYKYNSDKWEQGRLGEGLPED